eukprot:scaffold25377_cov24-Tisochrysis_lutea.AAC.7
MTSNIKSTFYTVMEVPGDAHPGRLELITLHAALAHFSSRRCLGPPPCTVLRLGSAQLPCTVLWLGSAATHSSLECRVRVMCDALSWVPMHHMHMSHQLHLSPGLLLLRCCKAVLKSSRTLSAHNRFHQACCCNISTLHVCAKTWATGLHATVRHVNSNTFLTHGILHTMMTSVSSRPDLGQHVAVKWFNKPQGALYGMCTKCMKPLPASPPCTLRKMYEAHTW